jgi:hypothetical protein
MGGYRVEQRFVNHRGRRFHFVSYDGRPANAKAMQLATGPAWFLMSGGKRWEVMPQVPGQDLAELDLQLTQWLDQQVFV